MHCHQVLMQEVSWKRFWQSKAPDEQSVQISISEVGSCQLLPHFAEYAEAAMQCIACHEKLIT